MRNPALRLTVGASAFFAATSSALQAWSTLPRHTLPSIQPVEVDFPEIEVDQLVSAICAHHNFTPTYENTRKDHSLGLSLAWLETATSHWANDFSWRKEVEAINRHPHFKATIQHPTSPTTSHVHVMALFSSRPDALPLILLHGWPGSFLEFMDLLDLVKEEYRPWSSPFHIIVPSLVGFTLSDGPPTDRDWTLGDTAIVMDNLMRDLGFGDGYVAHGGDVGSFIAIELARSSESCKAVHVNTFSIPRPSSVPPAENDSALTPSDLEILNRSAQQMTHGLGYALEQGTAPATISFTVSQSPIALLAWLGEKFMSWADPHHPLSLSKILTSVSLYHLTHTFPRSLSSYREIFGPSTPTKNPYGGFISKPFGYSRFRFDIAGVPPSWAAAAADLVFFNEHDGGGHFAALERPWELWEDIKEFVRIAMPP